MSEGMMNVETGGGRTERRRVDYPANSKKSKEDSVEKPALEKIISGDVIQRKHGLFGKVAGNFLSEDSGTVMSYVVMEVMLPAAKNMISDMVSQGVERMLFGDSRPRSGAGNRPGYTSYNNVSKPAQPRTMSKQSRATHDFNDIIFASRGEAEDVLDTLRALINQYDVATVNDLYDLLGLTGEFTDAKWGWFDLRSASIRPTRGGYLLDMPRTQPLT